MLPQFAILIFFILPFPTLQLPKVVKTVAVTTTAKTTTKASPTTTTTKATTGSTATTNGNNTNTVGSNITSTTTAIITTTTITSTTITTTTITTTTITTTTIPTTTTVNPEITTFPYLQFNLKLNSMINAIFNESYLLGYLTTLTKFMCIGYCGYVDSCFTVVFNTLTGDCYFYSVLANSSYVVNATSYNLYTVKIAEFNEDCTTRKCNPYNGLVCATSNSSCSCPINSTWSGVANHCQ